MLKINFGFQRKINNGTTECIFCSYGPIYRGYYYIQLKGTAFVLTRNHPDFPCTFPETQDGKKEAGKLAESINALILAHTRE